MTGAERVVSLAAGEIGYLEKKSNSAFAELLRYDIPEGAAVGRLVLHEMPVSEDHLAGALKFPK